MICADVHRGLESSIGSWNVAPALCWVGDDGRRFWKVADWPNSITHCDITRVNMSTGAVDRRADRPRSTRKSKERSDTGGMGTAQKHAVPTLDGLPPRGEGVRWIWHCNAPALSACSYPPISKTVFWKVHIWSYISRCTKSSLTYHQPFFASTTNRGGCIWPNSTDFRIVTVGTVSMGRIPQPNDFSYWAAQCPSLRTFLGSFGWDRVGAGLGFSAHSRTASVFVHQKI